MVRDDFVDRPAALSSPQKARRARSGRGGLHYSDQKFQSRLGPRFGRGRVLTGDEPPIGDDERDPVRYLFIESTQALQLILHEERHHLGEVDRFLLAVGEARHPLALHDRLVLELDAMQHAGPWQTAATGLPEL